MTKQSDNAQQEYNQASATLAAVAVTQYENSGQTSILGLLTSGDPSAVLGQASLLLQVEGTRNEEAQQFLILANELATIKQQRQRTATASRQLEAQFASQKTSMTKLLDTQTSVAQEPHRATAGRAWEARRSAAAPARARSPPRRSPTPGQRPARPIRRSPSPTRRSASRTCGAPPARLPIDCSGLMYAAWEAAGVTLPRTTYDEWANLPHIPMSDLQPGDLILYNGESHVAMYVGDGEIIDAPHTGAVVEKLPESTSWYADSADGAVRP